MTADLPVNPAEKPSSLSPDSEEPLMASLQEILLARERKRIHELEQKLADLSYQARAENDALRTQIQDLLSELEKLRRQARGTEDRALDLQTDVQLLKRKSQSDAEGVIARVSPVLSDMIGRTIRNSPDDMAEAMAPVMSEAIKKQIRDSRQDMVEALSPIIGDTVQKAVGEFAREFQRNIDARLRSTFGPQGMWRTMLARLRGVSPAELALRDALPFSIRQVFLIHRETGLLLAHYSSAEQETADSDLISGMLTAIRDFVRDSFGRGQAGDELDEVQYGNQRIILQSGRFAYLAVVITGVEPEGFRAYVRKWLMELHLKYETALQQFNGDPSNLTNVPGRLSALVHETVDQPERSMPMSRNTRLLLGLLGVLFILMLVLGCFYVQFTIALLPVAFPSPTPSNTMTPSPTATYTATFTPTASFTSTYTPTPTATWTATSTLTPSLTASPTTSLTPSLTFTPSLTPTPILAQARGDVWVRKEPLDASPRLWTLLEGTPVRILAQYGIWVKIAWTAPDGAHEGWTVLEWITLFEPISPGRITPTPTLTTTKQP